MSILSGKYVTRNELLVILIFIIYPLASLPLILVEIYNRKKYAYTLLSLFMGLCAILFPPFADLYRHQLDYYHFATGDLNILFSNQKNFDFILYFISKIFALTGIHFELIRFLFAFLSYQIIFWVFRDIVKNNVFLQQSQKYFFIAFICAFLAVPFIWIVTGLRYMMATMFVALGVYLLFFKNKKIGWLWIVIACCTHFGVLMIVLFMIIFKLFPFIKFGKKWTIITTIVLFLFSSSLMLMFYDLLTFDEDLKRVGYVYIKNTEEFNDARSLFGLIATIMERASLPLLIVLLFTEKKRYVYTSLYFAIVILIGLTQPFIVIFNRLTLTAVILMMISAISTFELSRYKMFMFKLLFAAMIITTIAYTYGYRDPLMKGKLYQILYKPAPIILIYEYDKRWIDSEIQPNGEFY